MKIYEYVGNTSFFFNTGHWYTYDECNMYRKREPNKWRQIDTDPTVAYTIELESCNAVITAESVRIEPDWKGFPPILTLEEMQRVTKCMEMLREVGE